MAGGLNFVTKPEGQEDKMSYPRNRKAFESHTMVQCNKLLLEGADGQVDQSKYKPNEKIKVACEMNNEVEALNLTLKRQF